MLQTTRSCQLRIKNVSDYDDAAESCSRLSLTRSAQKPLVPETDEQSALRKEAQSDLLLIEQEFAKFRERWMPVHEHSCLD